MRCVYILIALAVLLTYVTALEEKSSSKQVDGTNANDADDDYYDDDYDYALQDKKGHKHKHKFNKLFLFSGGLKSLAAFIAIKIKIILVVITIIGIIGFTLKVFGALKYAGYIGGVECPVVHEPAYGLGYSATPPPLDHVHDYGSYGSQNDWSSTGTYARSLVENYIDTDFISHALKNIGLGLALLRVHNQDLLHDQDQDYHGSLGLSLVLLITNCSTRNKKNMDMAEMVFSTLEMDDDQCRRRLVCEIDAKTRQLPFFSYAMEFFSRGFEKYRTPGQKKFNECAKLYSGCDDNKKSRRRRKRSVGGDRHKNYTPS